MARINTRLARLERTILRLLADDSETTLLLLGDLARSADPSLANVTEELPSAVAKASIGGSLALEVTKAPDASSSRVSAGSKVVGLPALAPMEPAAENAAVPIRGLDANTLVLRTDLDAIDSRVGQSGVESLRLCDDSFFPGVKHRLAQVQVA
ncbi:MAG: hypothetical protein WD250_09545 [Egibacteraceae bacterium]